MHVGFYLNTTHLASWDWSDVLQARTPLSGTDGTVLRVVHTLATDTSIEVTLLTTVEGTSPSATPTTQVVVRNLTEAVHHACTHQLDTLVFPNAKRPDVIDGVHQAEQLHQSCVAWCHNGPWRDMAQLYSNSDAVERVLCVSHRQADLFRDKKVFSKIEVVPNGICINQFPPKIEDAQSELTACYVGALTPSQGFHILAESWPQVRSSFPNAQLIVVGSPQLYNRNATLGPLGVANPEYEKSRLIPYLGSSQEKAKERHGVVFAGLLPPKQTWAVMGSSLVGVVNPNTKSGALETFCVTAIEMQAMETAVVGGCRRGLRETVRNGETGVLIDVPHQLAPTLCRLFRNPEKTKKMGKHGRQWVTETYDFSHIAQRWVQILTSISRDKPPNPPPFSFQRATPKTLLREGIRQLHKCAGQDNRISFVDNLIEATRG